MSTSLGQRYHVALITGAGSGIGRELARKLAAQGVSIAAIDKHEEGLRSLEAELKQRNQPIAWAQADVTDAAALDVKSRELETALGPIDLLIASAGIGIETSAFNLCPKGMADVLGVNLIGVVNSIAAVLPGMLHRRKGHIVGLSSLASFRGLPRMLGYCASKAAVNSLLEAIRAEVGHLGIDATTVCPGWTKTPMTDKIPTPLPGLMTLDYATDQILWAIRKKKAFHAFPRRLVWRLKFLSWLPRHWQDRMIRRMIK